jgi:5-methylcytosine-specific restriction enzyme A
MYNAWGRLMATFLLTWNPRRTPWVDLLETALRVNTGEAVLRSWSCGNTRRINPGDRLFLHRQGKVDPGLIGSAWATSAPYQDDHWEDQLGDAPDMAWYVELEWDVLSSEAIIARDRLLDRFSGVNWNTQASGISIPEAVAHLIEQEWQRGTGSSTRPSADEYVDPSLPEGARRTVTINRYERERRLRAACLAHHGYACICCGRKLSDTYGPEAETLIQVHHLTPLGTAQRRHLVDPHSDLVPVCPNCHAVLHSRNPPFSPEQVRTMLR